MNSDFDFDKIGKRMPYITPEGFFDQMEAQVMRQVTVTARPARKRLRMTVRTMVVAAAAIALLLIVGIRSRSVSPVTVHDVEQAFDQLSAADQDFLRSVYQADIFIHEQ